MNFSTYQESIFQYAKKQTGHAIIQACAGSGKTTTLLEIMKIVKGKTIFLAFNKAIADELKRKVPSTVECSTLHSAGYAIIRNNIGKVKVDNFKIDNIMNNYLPLAYNQSMTPEEKAKCFNERKNVKGLVSLIKNNLVDYTNELEFAEMADHYGLDYDPKYTPHVKYIIEKNNSQTDIIDFDDMIYLPVILNFKAANKYDFVLVDESQDLNRSQIELVLSIVNKKSGRVFAVGDSKQSIYGFRGADTEAMSRIQTVLQAKELPLSICYRCPSSHIELVKDLVPNIEARPNAPIGIIEHINADQFIDTVTKEKSPLILSRTNAYMISFALKMIAQGHKATIKGRDIGQNLISLVKKNSKDNDSIYTMIENLGSWKNSEIEKLSKRHAAQSTIDNVEDKYNTIIAVCEDCKNIDCVINKLQALFTDDTTANYIFSSIHKAKGLEADTVYILTPHLLPLTHKNQKDWEKDQELNIKYVALTRSKNKMVFVNPAN